MKFILDMAFLEYPWYKDIYVILRMVSDVSEHEFSLKSNLNKWKNPQSRNSCAVCTYAKAAQMINSLIARRRDTRQLRGSPANRSTISGSYSPGQSSTIRMINSFIVCEMVLLTIIYRVSLNKYISISYCAGK